MLINVCYKCASISSSEGCAELTLSLLQSLFALLGLLFGVDEDIVTIVTKSLFSLLVVLVVLLVASLLPFVVVYVKLFLLPNTLGLNLSFKCCCCWCCCRWVDGADGAGSPSSSCIQMVVDEEDFSLVVVVGIELETISISARVDR